MVTRQEWMDVHIREHGLRLYHRVFIQGWLRRIGSVLSGRSPYLLNLASVRAACHIMGQHFAGVQTVSIQQIVGSEGRSTDFDCGFAPQSMRSKQRWLGIAAAWYKSVPLPPIELIQVDGSYFIRDGHHRVSVARAAGQREIDALVTVWQVRALRQPDNVVDWEGAEPQQGLQPCGMPSPTVIAAMSYRL